MLPTIKEGDRVVTIQTYPLLKQLIPNGSVVCFHPQGDTTQTFIKRIIARPGDTISIQNGVLMVNNQPSPYQTPGTITSPGLYLTEPITLDKDEYFMLGDNRTNSQDSRYIGPVKSEWIISQMVGTYWPTNRIHLGVNNPFA